MTYAPTMPPDDDPWLDETAHLMRSEVNVERLLEAMERLEANDGRVRNIIDAD